MGFCGGNRMPSRIPCHVLSLRFDAWTRQGSRSAASAEVRLVPGMAAGQRGGEPRRSPGARLLGTVAGLPGTRSQRGRARACAVPGTGDEDGRGRGEWASSSRWRRRGEGGAAPRSSRSCVGDMDAAPVLVWGWGWGN